MRNIGAVSSNNSAASLGSASGTTSIFAGAQQAGSTPGGFEGILELLAGLISSDQTDQGNQGDSSAALSSSGNLVDSSQSSQNSKQFAGQFSQIPNGSLVAGNATNANGSVTTVTGGQSSQIVSTDTLGLGSTSQKGTATPQKQANQDIKNSSQQSDTSSIGVDPFMIAAATAAALQSPAAPAPVINNAASIAPSETVDSTAAKVSTAVVANASTVFDTSAAAAAFVAPAASTTSIPQNAPTDIANLAVSDNSQPAIGVASSAKNNDATNASGQISSIKAVAGLTPEVTQTTEQNIAGSSTGTIQKTALFQHAYTGSNESAVAQNLSSQVQSGAENASAVSGEQVKKIIVQTEGNPVFSKDTKSLISSVVSGQQGSQAANLSHNGATAAGTDSAIGQTANTLQDSGSSASLTMQELSAVQATNTGVKKGNESGKTGTSSDVTNFAAAARAEIQMPAQGSSEKAITSDLATQTGTNPFGALDSAPTTSEQQAQLLKASHKEMEVGVQDPQYGWVEVKTQMNAGQVTASLSVGSVEAQHALQQELPAMQHFVASRDLDLSSLSVSTGTDSGAGMYHQQSGQGNGDQNQSFGQVPAGEAWGGQSPSKVAPVAATENAWMPETASRISVMA